MTRKHRSLEEWMEIIKTCRNSGLTDKQWCLENHVSLSTFHKRVCYLRKKSYTIPSTNAKKSRPQTTAMQEVVPLDIVDREHPAFQTDQSSMPAVRIFTRSLQVDLENHASPELVRNVLQTLEGLC